MGLRTEIQVKTEDFAALDQRRVSIYLVALDPSSSTSAMVKIARVKTPPMRISVTWGSYHTPVLSTFLRPTPPETTR